MALPDSVVAYLDSIAPAHITLNAATNPDLAVIWGVSTNTAKVRAEGMVRDGKLVKVKTRAKNNRVVDGYLPPPVPEPVGRRVARR